MKNKIWIDTDIGGDIDDAFALCLAMNSPEVELVGVSTVFCDVRKRAKIAKALLAAGGFGSVPVYAGCAEPLAQTEMYGSPISFGEPPVSYCEMYDSVVYDGDDAVEQMAKAFSENKGMALVTIGALTNAAKLIKEYPEAAENIGFISIMGGAYDMNFAEFNFACDPEAADTVLSSPLPKYLVGLDVTFKCRMSDSQRIRLEQSEKPSVKLLLKLAKSWHGGVYFHDPLALMCVFDPQYVKFVPRYVKVETKGGYTRGMAVDLSNYAWKRDPDGINAKYAAAVNADAFTEECINRILR